MRQPPLVKLFFLGLCSVMFSVYTFFLVQSLLPHQGMFSQARWVQVSAPDLRLREEPALEAPVVKHLYFGEKVELLTERGNWLEVQDDRGYTGWVNRQHVVYSPPGLQ